MRRALLSLLALALPTLADAATFDVAPDTAPRFHADDIKPGDSVRLHAGHYRGSIVIPLHGTPAAPIEIFGSGPLEIDGALSLDNAEFISLHNLTITRASDAGIILRHGSHDIIVRDSAISNAGVGIWIGDKAGDNNRVAGNVIGDNRNHGIAVDGVNAAPGRETVIAGNRIEHNGAHGIELSGNHYLVADNNVSGNGWRVTGASGIHLYAANARQDVCRHNVIRGNTSFANHDATGQDGNGIQLDQWCDDNEVSGNIAVANDGAGISVFDAGTARIRRNTLYDNMRDPGRSHRHKADLLFASDDSGGVDGTRDAVVEANIVIAARPGVAAVLVDVPTARHPPLFAGNLFDHEGHGDVARWQSAAVVTIAAWNALAPHRLPDIAGDPQFADRTQPTRAGFAVAPAFARAWPQLGAVSAP